MKRTFFGSIFLFLLLLVTIEESQGQNTTTRTIYISPSGSDSNSGLSAQEAVLTLSLALQLGNDIVFASGSYDGGISQLCAVAVPAQWQSVSLRGASSDDTYPTLDLNSCLSFLLLDSELQLLTLSMLNFEYYGARSPYSGAPFLLLSGTQRLVIDSCAFNQFATFSQRYLGSLSLTTPSVFELLDRATATVSSSLFYRVSFPAFIGTDSTSVTFEATHFYSTNPSQPSSYSYSQTIGFFAGTSFARFDDSLFNDFGSPYFYSPYIEGLDNASFAFSDTFFGSVSRNGIVSVANGHLDFTYSTQTPCTWISFTSSSTVSVRVGQSFAGFEPLLVSANLMSGSVLTVSQSLLFGALALNNATVQCTDAFPLNISSITTAPMSDMSSFVNCSQVFLGPDYTQIQAQSGISFVNDRFVPNQLVATHNTVAMSEHAQIRFSSLPPNGSHDNNMQMFRSYLYLNDGCEIDGSVSFDSSCRISSQYLRNYRVPYIATTAFSFGAMVEYQTSYYDNYADNTKLVILSTDSMTGTPELGYTCCLKTSNLRFQQNNNGRTELYVLIESSGNGSRPDNSKGLVIFGIIFGSIVFLCLVIGGLFWVFMMRKRTNDDPPVIAPYETVGSAPFLNRQKDSSDDEAAIPLR